LLLLGSGIYLLRAVYGNEWPFGPTQKKPELVRQPDSVES